MEHVIEFITKNIYFVVIVGGFLLSIFNRVSAKKRTNPRMPDFNGQSTADAAYPQQGTEVQQHQSGRYDQGEAYPEWEDNDDYEERSISYRQAEEEAEREKQRHLSELARALESKQKQQVPITASQQREAAAGRSNRASSEAEAAADTRLAPLSAEELRKAVIWSEILGPSKSKRPYGKVR
ncbi:hypothetical protein [Paenibacillus sp. Leaf72]|uniref:hypothetical protein n=1 Tax=Paenibacillus sp. Leaf72 TaxID=1736234 RepID=UPI0006FEE3B1|nr:hypothetical protein [Paenibacillus sp. Leaf72]KQO17654.1 hypothetical protein ASF12_03000 [Paenibacillus sp. Leaf72]